MLCCAPQRYFLNNIASRSLQRQKVWDIMLGQHAFNLKSPTHHARHRGHGHGPAHLQTHAVGSQQPHGGGHQRHTPTHALGRPVRASTASHGGGVPVHPLRPRPSAEHDASNRSAVVDRTTPRHSARRQGSNTGRSGGSEDIWAETALPGHVGDSGASAALPPSAPRAGAGRVHPSHPRPTATPIITTHPPSSSSTPVRPVCRASLMLPAVLSCLWCAVRSCSCSNPASVGSHADAGWSQVLLVTPLSRIFTTWRVPARVQAARALSWCPSVVLARRLLTCTPRPYALLWTPPSASTSCPPRHHKTQLCSNRSSSVLPFSKTPCYPVSVVCCRHRKCCAVFPTCLCIRHSVMQGSTLA